MPKETIDVATTSITFDRNLNESAGHLKVVPGDTPILDNHGETLLHLLFFLTYTKEGRDLLRNNRPHRPSGGPLTEEDARKNLQAALKRFSKVSPIVLDMVIATHLAADGFAAAIPHSAAAGAQEVAYSQKLLAVLGALHDDAMGHEFSMNW